MTRLFLKIYDLLSRHRTAAGTATVLLLALFAALAARMHYDEDISAFIPLDRQNEKYSEIFNSTGGENRIAVIFKEKENDNTAITRAMERFAEIAALRDTSCMIRNLHVKSSGDDATGLISAIWQCYPLLLTDADYGRLDSLASREGFFTERMNDNKMMLMLPGSGIAAQGISYDPLQASGKILKRLQALGNGSGYETSDGYLFKDGCGIVLLESPFGISESQKNGELQHLLDSCMAETASTENGITISAVGAPLIAATNATRIKKDTALAIAIAVVLIFAVLLYTFRRMSDLLWIAVSLLAGWIFALGTVSLIRDSISLIVIGIGSVIIGIAANYPLHLIDHLKHETNMREVLREMVPPLLVGNITTVGAFLCLLLLDARAMKDLGLFASLMLIGTILFTLVCLPLFVKPVRAGSSFGITRVQALEQLPAAAAAAFATCPVWSRAADSWAFRLREAPLSCFVIPAATPRSCSSSSKKAWFRSKLSRLALGISRGSTTKNSPIDQPLNRGSLNTVLRVCPSPIRIFPFRSRRPRMDLSGMRPRYPVRATQPTAEGEPSAPVRVIRSMSEIRSVRFFPLSARKVSR